MTTIRRTCPTCSPPQQSLCISVPGGSVGTITARDRKGEPQLGECSPPMRFDVWTCEAGHTWKEMARP